VHAPPLSPNLLAGLSLVVAALLLLAVVAAVVPRRRASLAYRGTLALCALGGLLDLTFLLGGAAPCGLALPFGLPGAGLSLGLDGLSAFFLLLPLQAGAAASAAALDAPGEAAASTPFFPAFVGAMALALLAADGFALVLGLALMSLAASALVLTRQHEAEVRAAALSCLGMAAFGAACLIPALALLAHPAPGGLDFRFAAMRAHPPEGWRAALVLALALLGAGSKAGLAPLHAWLPPAHAAAPAPVSALMSGAMTKVALYVLIRVLFDLCGPAQPGWWAVPLLLLGAAAAVLGALRANVEGDITLVLACSTVGNVGLITIGLGVGLAARAADLSPLAALALGGALLHTLAHGLFKTLLFLAAGAVQHGAGSRRLERLGGLIHAMPVTTACVLVGGACLAALPPSSGFAGAWTLFQAVLGAPRVGGLAMPMLIAVVAMLMALAVALAAAAAVRLVGVAFLGRPRSPRAAAADEAGRFTRAALIGLAGLSGAIGLFPGAVLALAGPALRLLVSVGMEGRISVLRLSPQADAPGYAAPAVAVLLALALALVLWLLRTRAAAGHRVGPAWDCGFGAPPPWLPFGDPLTQYSGASFGQPLRRTLGALLAARESVDMPEPGDTRPARIEASFTDPAEAWLFRPLARWRDRLFGHGDAVQLLTIRRTLAVVFVALVALLVLVALAEQP
jgi:formate hydrogenlyase subunit 3/multisubunit Na+/H+ antiporter MnhD subunit